MVSEVRQRLVAGRVVIEAGPHVAPEAMADDVGAAEVHREQVEGLVAGEHLVIFAGGHHFMETPIGDSLIAYALPS